MCGQLRNIFFTYHLGLRKLCARVLNIRLYTCIPYKSRNVHDYLRIESIKNRPFLHNSPNICHCHLFLFPRLKRMLSGRSYNSIKPLGSALNQWLNSIPNEDYFAAFWSLVSRLEKYISVKGEHFERMK